MGRWTIGRRRYSWERRDPIPQARPVTPAANLIASTIVVLGASYIWLRPVFWIFTGLLGFIAVCGIAVVVLSLWEHGRGLVRSGRQAASPTKPLVFDLVRV